MGRLHRIDRQWISHGGVRMPEMLTVELEHFLIPACLNLHALHSAKK